MKYSKHSLSVKRDGNGEAMDIMKVTLFCIAFISSLVGVAKHEVPNMAECNGSINRLTHVKMNYK